MTKNELLEIVNSLSEEVDIEFFQLTHDMDGGYIIEEANIDVLVELATVKDRVTGEERILLGEHADDDAVIKRHVGFLSYNEI